MSAVFGIISFNSESVEEKHLQMMRNKVSHYGMDGQDYILDNNIGIGSCLNKISVHSNDDMPFLNDMKNGIILVCDAIIYNREELISQYELANDCNITTEQLLLKAYLMWGELCPKYINGDFVFAVWDKKKQTAFIFRDHLGVRPLYYFYDSTTFAFSTDYRALLDLPFVSDQIDEVMLYAKLSDTYHIDTESTFFKEIKRLQQAHTLCVNSEGIRKKKYWDLGKEGKTVCKTEKEYAEKIFEIVNNAIKRRVNCIKANIGSELSGGIDSSVVTVLANRELAPKVKLKAYSWSPSFKLLDKKSRDERTLIELICQNEGITCQYRTKKPIPNNEQIDRPVLTNGQRRNVIRDTYKEMAEQDIRVVLSGWGGDQGISHWGSLAEIFREGDIKNYFIESKHRANGSWFGTIKVLIFTIVNQLFSPYSIFGKQNKDMPLILNKDWIKKVRGKCKRDKLYFFVAPVKNIESGAIVSRTELSAWIGADDNIQCIYPLLDYEVVDFAMSIPRHLFYKKGIKRYIFRKAFENILPKEICYYTYKYEVAKSTYIEKIQNDQTRAEIVTKLLDIGFFSKYIDFDIWNKLVEGKFFQEYTRTSKFTLWKIEDCYDLQRIIEMSNKNE